MFLIVFVILLVWILTFGILIHELRESSEQIHQDLQSILKSQNQRFPQESNANDTPKQIVSENSVSRMAPQSAALEPPPVPSTPSVMSHAPSNQSFSAQTVPTSTPTLKSTLDDISSQTNSYSKNNSKPTPSSDKSLNSPAPSKSQSLESSAEYSHGWNWFWYGREIIGQDENREFIMASNWLIRFGMLILVLGIGFFVKYSIDQGWLGPEMRILGTTAIGLGMFILGMKLWHSSLNLLGQALIAGSTSVLYFSAYGASSLYHLIPESYGLLWSCGVTAALVFISIKWNSRLIAVLGTLGAYLTPCLFQFLRLNETFLAFYLALPALGIIFIRWNRTWSLPTWIAFAGTCFHWAKIGFQNQEALVAISPFESTVILSATFFFLLAFHLMAQRRIRKITVSTTLSDLVLAFLNAIFFCTMLQNLLDAWDPGVSLLGIPHTSAAKFGLGIASIVYFLAFCLLKPFELNRPFRAMNCALGFVVLMLTAGNSLGTWDLPCLLIICAALQSAAQKIPSNSAAWLVRILTIPLACVAFYVLADYYHGSNGNFWYPDAAHASFHFDPENQWDCLRQLPERTLRFLTPGVSLLILACSAYRARLREKITGSLEMAQIFAILAVLYLWCWITLETSLSLKTYLPSMRLGGISIAWVLLALSLLVIGIWKNLKTVRIAALCFFALSIGKIFLWDLSSLQTVYRIFAFILLGIMLLGGGIIYLKNLRNESPSPNESPKHPSN